MEKWSRKRVEQAFACPLTRRQFLRGLMAAGALAALPGGLMKAEASPFDIANDEIFFEGPYETFRNACPRNCYDTCSIKTFVKDGAIHFIEGAPESTFTDGALCVKGNSYWRQVYSPDRIKYPMMQDGRGSGNWKRLSWDEALERIAKKILELKEKDGSLLGMGLTKYSGNFGITNYGVEGMMSSLGYTTRFVGTPCWPAGIDAQNYDMGNMWCNDPEDMVNSRYIMVWGANPAWCSVHTMKYIYDAQDRGAKVLVIDPVFTQTAAKADEYWQVKTGEDGALALGMARHILDKDMVDREFVDKYSHGFKEFEDYLKKEITLEWAAEKTGIPAGQIARAAEEFASHKPASIWIGYGLQRHVNGGVTVRAIDALVAMTGNIGKIGGGARYGHLSTWGFNYHALVQKQPEGSVGYTGKSGPKGEFTPTLEEASYSDRTLNINQTARGILETNDPPVRMLWVSCKNPFSQDFDLNMMKKAFDKLEMVVVADKFFTQTVEQADIVLPVTTLFEEWTVNVSYWHYWLSLNEQAIKPMYESKSNIEIAAALSKRINQLAPGSCTFATDIDTKEWMTKEFNKGIYDLFGIESWEDLRQGPRKAKLTSSASWHDLTFGTPSKKYEFLSQLAADHGHEALPKYKSNRKSSGPFRLLTPHSKFNIHSQFQHIDYMEDFSPEPFVYIHPAAAAEKNIVEGDWVNVTNKVGEVKIKAKLTDNVPRDVLLMYEAWFNKNSYNVQNLVDDESADMGLYKTGAPGVAIHDQFADVAKA
jgi:anaerobic selenocysteine-containing dehydrogenase